MGNPRIYLIINVTITLGGNSEDIVNLQNYLIADITFQTIKILDFLNAIMHD